MRLGFSCLLYSFYLVSMLSFYSCSSSQKEIQAKNAEVYYAQGTSELIQKNYTQALQSFLQAYRITPDNPDLLNNLAMAYYFKEQYGLSEEFLLKALKLNPNHSDARSNLGAMYMKKGDLDKAEEEFLHVSKDLVYENQFRISYNLGLISLSKNQREQAKKYFAEAVKNKEDYCPAHFQLGKIHFDEQKFADALKEFKESSKGVCYNEPTPLYYQGITYIKLDNFVRARDALQDLVKRFPQDHYAIIGKDKLNGIKAKLPADSREYEEEEGEIIEAKTAEKLRNKKDLMSIDKVLEDEGLPETISQ